MQKFTGAFFMIKLPTLIFGLNYLKAIGNLRPPTCGHNPIEISLDGPVKVLLHAHLLELLLPLYPRSFVAKLSEQALRSGAPTNPILYIYSKYDVV